MKLLFINASNRGVHGLTRFYTDLLVTGASTVGVECQVLDLARLTINPCLNCDRCQSEAHRFDCVWRQKDDTQVVFTAMAAADLIVFAAPVYIFGLPAQLKALFERYYGICKVGELSVTRSGRMFHHVDPAVCSKPFAALLVCDNLEAEMPANAIHYFRTYSRFMDAPLVGILVRNGGRLIQATRANPGLLSPSHLEAIDEAFRQAGRELAQERRIHPATARRASAELIQVPFFSLFKRLHLRGLKEEFVKRAQQML